MEAISPLFWAGLLLLTGMALVALEVFVPTGGLLGFLSVTSILAAIILAFYNGGAMAGFIFLLATAVALPTVLGLAFRWLPETAIGRRLLPTLPKSEEVLPDSEERRMLRTLVGKVGRTKSPMMPSGAVVVEGRTIDAVSQGMAIDRDQPVRVVAVRGTRVVVRPVEEGTPLTPSDDLLSRPIDALGFDPFDDPPAGSDEPSA